MHLFRAHAMLFLCVEVENRIVIREQRGSPSHEVITPTWLRAGCQQPVRQLRCNSCCVAHIPSATPERQRALHVAFLTGTTVLQLDGILLAIV